MKYICECGNPSITTLFKFKSGSRCKDCGIKKMQESQRHSLEYVKKYFESHDCELLENDYVNSHTPMKYNCSCGNESLIGFSSFASGVRCMKCWISKSSGEGHWNWKGGISPLQNYLRTKINDWKIESLIHYNYRCDISNRDGTLEIHHLYSFAKILDETMFISQLPTYSIVKQYAADELILIEEILLKLHNKYGFGVPLTKELHEEFHLIYGKFNFTPENYEEFKQIKLLDFQSES